jgi:class 3 adenylate cyclase
MKEERVERRLAAVLAVDIAVHSRLMDLDEEGTLRDLKSHRRALIDPKITEPQIRLRQQFGMQAEMGPIFGKF